METGAETIERQENSTACRRGKNAYLEDMSVLRKSRPPAHEIEARISVILTELQPLLRIDHCRLELIEFVIESGAATLRIGGECPDCEVSPLTFSTAIAAHLKLRVPEVREVRISA